MSNIHIPKHATVLIVGGGPAGSYAAAVLAREGIDVVVLEMSQFPRYHIGESLLPSVRHYLRFIGAEDKVANYGFAKKPGSAIKFNQYVREGYTDFIALGASNNAWNVVRSEFDKILFDHASESGAHTFTQTRVTAVQFSKMSSHVPSPAGPVDFGEMGRPISASYENADGIKGDISFDYIIDASGRAGLLSTKYLKNRKYNQSLKNVAVWGYWSGTSMYGKSTDRENAPFFEALSDESGWAWFIPLHNGTTSVGIVMDQKQLGIRSRAASSATNAPLPADAPKSQSTNARHHNTLADRYLTFLHLAPTVQALIGDGKLECVDDENGQCPAARSASDFSYSADVYAGPGWRMVGDAGAFIDPFFSSGVHLAMTSALSAAATIMASIHNDCSEEKASLWHSQRVSISYTRFLVVVLSAYKQIRSQSENVLVDIDEGSFDKAFTFFRPVIQGGAEMGARLSEDEVQRALDFCVQLFSPTTPEQHSSVRRRLLVSQWDPSEDDEMICKDSNEQSSPSTKRIVDRLLDVRAPIVCPGVLTRLLRTKLCLFRNPLSTLTSPGSSTISSLFSPSASPTTSCFSDSDESEKGTDLSVQDEGDDEMRMVLEKVNARRVIYAEHGGLNSLEEEAVDGLVVRLTRGRVGLMKTVRRVVRFL